MVDMAGYPGTPRWVKRFGIIALFVTCLAALHKLVGPSPGHLHPEPKQESSAAGEGLEGDR